MISQQQQQQQQQQQSPSRTTLLSSSAAVANILFTGNNTPIRNNTSTMPSIPPQSQLETNSIIAKPDDNGMVVSAPSTLPLFEMMREDWLLIPTRDPATPNIWHALFFSTGLWAIWLYRLSHALWNLNLHFLAKCIATFSRVITCMLYNSNKKKLLLLTCN